MAKQILDRVTKGSQSDNYNDFSVKESVHAFNRYVPVDSTLSAAGTAEDLVNLEDSFGPAKAAAVNIFRNPSYEATATGLTDVGATSAKQATNPRSGSNSVEITPDNSATGEGSYFTVTAGGLGTFLVASSWFRRDSGSGDDARIAIRDTDDTLLAAGNTITLSTTYQRSVAVYALPATAATYRIYQETVTQHGTAIRLDDTQVELNDTGKETDFINVTDGEINCEWQGAANASFSQRLAPISVIKGFTLTVENGDVYIAFDHTANSTHTGILVKSGTSWSTEWPVDIRENISFLNATAGQTPRIYGSVWGRAKI